MNSLVARNAIQAVGRIALRLPSRANFCVDKLLALLQLKVDYITSETVVVMTSESMEFECHMMEKKMMVDFARCRHSAQV